MAEKKEAKTGKVNITTWLTESDSKKLDSIIAAKTAELQKLYPGARITRHSIIQRVILDWMGEQ